MKFFKTFFAGVIALLCTLTLSTASAQVDPRDMVFTSCGSKFQFESVTFNQVTNEFTLKFKDRSTSPEITKWDSVKLRWFANVQTTLPERTYFDSLGIHMSWQMGTTGKKHANMSADVAVKKVTITDTTTYTFVCQLSPEQAEFLRSVHAVPGQCDGFSFGTLSTPY